MKRIMLIDQDLSHLRATAACLSDGFRTLICTRGANAMDLYQVFLPHAILLDPATPGLEGRRFIEKIRERPGGYRVPILGATRFTGPRTLEDALEWKLDALYAKPCSPAKLRSKLMDLLGMPQPRADVEGAPRA